MGAGAAAGADAGDAPEAEELMRKCGERGRGVGKGKAAAAGAARLWGELAA